MDRHWIGVVGTVFLATAASAMLAWFPRAASGVDIVPDNPLDTSNFHSISTTIQVTVLALIIPLAVVLHEFVLTGRRLTKHAISFFLKGSNVALITTSSVAYLGWVIVFEVAAAYLDVELHPVAAVIEAAWLLFNLYLIAEFMLRAYRMLDRNEFDAEVRRHLVLGLYPQELIDDLVGVSYLMLPGRDHDLDMDDPGPVVSVGLYREGTVEAEYASSRPCALKDVDRRLLTQLFKIWRLRNAATRPRPGRRRSGPRLSILPSLGLETEGRVPLLVSVDAKPLNGLERLATRRAFIFGRPEKRERVNTKDTLDAVAGSAVNELRSGDLDQFSDSVHSLVDTHAELLALGEAVDETGSAWNYASIEKSLFGRIYDTWPRAYSRIYEAAVRTVEFDIRTLGVVAGLGPTLAAKVVRLPSKTSLDLVVSIQAQLHYRMSDWWEHQADLQGADRSITAPYKLKPPVSKTYERSLRTVASSWDTVLSRVLIGSLPTAATWQDCGLIHWAIIEHLRSTSLFIARCCLAGDEEGALFWANEFRRWSLAVRNIERNAHTNFNARQSSFLSISCLTVPWDEIVTLLRGHQDYDQQYYVREVFRTVLLNLGKDIRLVLIAFLLQWNGAKADANSLVIRVIRHISNDSAREDDGGDGAPVTPAKNIHDYLTFLMRTAIVEVGQGSNSGVVERFADSLRELTTAPYISGRIYSSTGLSSDIVDGEILLVASSAMSAKAQLPPIIDKYAPLFGDHALSGRATAVTKSRSDDLRSLEVKKDVDRFAAISGATTARASTARTLSRQVGQLSALLMALSKAASVAQDDRLEELPVSENRLRDFAAAVSPDDFKKETGPFPIGLFKRVDYTRAKLDSYKHPVPKVSRAHVVEASDVRASSLESFVSSEVRRLIGPVVTVDIANAAKSRGQMEDVTYADEQGFADAFVDATTSSADADYLLLVPAAGQPEFFRRWQQATWLEDAELPRRIVVSRIAPNGVSFSVNDIPVHEIDIGADDIFLIPKAALDTLEFREFDDQLPVQVSFAPLPGKPTLGTLFIELERRVTLDPAYKVFHFSPKK